MNRLANFINGWPLFFLLSGIALAACMLALGSADEPGVRALVRLSARFAAAYFIAAFVASSLLSLRRSAATLWLRRNRRPIGVAFAFAHTIHLAGLGALAIKYPSPFLEHLSLLTVVGGGLAYLFIYAMAFTSSDAAVRALGPQNWQRLHWWGGWVIWVVFTQTVTLGALAGEASQIVPALAFWLAVTIRILGWSRTRRDGKVGRRGAQ